MGNGSFYHHHQTPSIALKSKEPSTLICVYIIRMSEGEGDGVKNEGKPTHRYCIQDGNMCAWPRLNRPQNQHVTGCKCR